MLLYVTDSPSPSTAESPLMGCPPHLLRLLYLDHCFPPVPAQVLALVLTHSTALRLNCSGWEEKRREEETGRLYLNLCQLPQETQDPQAVPDFQDVNAHEALWSVRQLAAALPPASVWDPPPPSLVRFPPGACCSPLCWLDGVLPLQCSGLRLARGGIREYLLDE